MFGNENNTEKENNKITKNERQQRTAICTHKHTDTCAARVRSR